MNVVGAPQNLQQVRERGAYRIGYSGNTPQEHFALRPLGSTGADSAVGRVSS